MSGITVYRIDYAKKTKVRIGTVVERRLRERGDNIRGLLLLARKYFANCPQEAFLTTIDLREARMSLGTGGRALPSL